MSVLNASEARKLQQDSNLPQTNDDDTVSKAMEKIFEEIRRAVSLDRDASSVTYLYEDDYIGHGMIYTTDERYKLVDLIPLKYYEDLKERLEEAGYTVRRQHARSLDRISNATGRIVVSWR